jgi:hypothetical protein
MIRTKGKKDLLLARVRNFLKMREDRYELLSYALLLKKNVIMRLIFKRANN